MLQRINLYRIAAKGPEEKILLTWERLWISHIVILTLLILLHLNDLWGLHQVRKERKHAQLAEKKLQLEIQNKKATLPPEFFVKDVNTAVVNLKKELENEQKLIEAITNKVPFSQYLIAFSKLIVPNVWLININITGGGNELVLKGSSMGPESLQKFMQNITHDKLFSEHELTVKNISSPGSDPNDKIDFEIMLTGKVKT